MAGSEKFAFESCNASLAAMKATVPHLVWVSVRGAARRCSLASSPMDTPTRGDSDFHCSGRGTAPAVRQAFARPSSRQCAKVSHYGPGPFSYGRLPSSEHAATKLTYSPNDPEKSSVASIIGMPPTDECGEHTATTLKNGRGIAINRTLELSCTTAAAVRPRCLTPRRSFHKTSRPEALGRCHWTASQQTGVSSTCPIPSR